MTTAGRKATTVNTDRARSARGMGSSWPNSVSFCIQDDGLQVCNFRHCRFSLSFQTRSVAKVGLCISHAMFLVTGLGGCLASTAALCACQACSCVSREMLRKSARLAYCTLFFAAVVCSWVLRDFAKPIIEKLPCAPRWVPFHAFVVFLFGHPLPHPPVPAQLCERASSSEQGFCRGAAYIQATSGTGSKQCTACRWATSCAPHPHA